MSTPLRLSQPATKGLERNQPRELLSKQQAWILKNARSFQNKLEASPGRTAYITDTLTGQVMSLLTWEKDDGTFRVNAFTEQKIYKIDADSGVVTDITRLSGNYTGSVVQPVDTVAGFDHALSTNLVDNPQKWNGTTANASDIGGTPGKAGTVTVALSYCILGNLVGNVRGIKWSDSGTFEDWAAGDAGNFTFFQGPGKVLKVLALSEFVVVYRSQSIHMMFFVGSPFIWGQRQIVGDHGLIAQHAVTSVQGRHVYWGTDNVYIFDGSQRIPIADSVIDEMNASFDPSFQNNIKAFADLTQRELYFTYPGIGDLGINKRAWVFNWQTGIWRREDITATAAATWRRRVDNSWANSTDTWATISGTWGQGTFAAKAPVVLVGTDSGKVNFIDTATVDDVGVARERLYESGLFNPGLELFEDDSTLATLERVEIEQENKGTHNLEVWIGTQEVLTGDSGIVWTQYTIVADGTKRKISVRKTSRHFAIRYRTAGLNEGFRISGLTAYFSKRGNRS